MRCCMTIPSPGPHSAASTHLVRGLLRLGVAEQIRHPQLEGGQHFLDSAPGVRSEEHTSELQSRENLVCRLLLEKKKKINNRIPSNSPPVCTLHRLPHDDSNR